MTIGIAVSGPMAGLGAFQALRAVERVGRGALGGFVSFVALTQDGRLMHADTQRGGTSTLFTVAEATGTLPPAAFAAAPLAALMSSGPNRPEPLMQFTPADASAGVVTGHRLPNMPGVDGVPLNVAVLERLKTGESPQAAVEAELARNPRADAGLIAVNLKGELFAGDTQLVLRRPDRGAHVGQDPRTGARCAVLHNSIFPVDALARLAVAVALDTIAPLDHPDFHVTVKAGTPLARGSEPCLELGQSDQVTRLVVDDQVWLGGTHDGAVIPHGAAVRRSGKLVGRVIFEPYCRVEQGVLVSLSGLDEAVIAVRAEQAEGVQDHRALG